MPSSVLTPHVVSYNSTSITVAWLPPLEHTECTLRYRVCYTLESGGEGTQCVNTPPVTNYDSEVSVTLSGLSACAEYYITVAPVSVSGRLGPAVPLEQSTDLAGKSFYAPHCCLPDVHLYSKILFLSFSARRAHEPDGGGSERHLPQPDVERSGAEPALRGTVRICEIPLDIKYIIAPLGT